ncbi:alpha/beta fold hydrolase [Cytophagales bacterium LB-30]|uniref:Alpha/beta fold hydrolase n=1 Tax=Shiella aurantiaca TaxID=3058365 RepID=A0ABT8F382_9BACT|nr:alpha/beta fold hydrolase [Shiella aurantiaca]MDN4164922.1 alpha/beta fold hydrolase [Shiella aurantiaca]
MIEESLFLPFQNGQLHIRHFSQHPAGIPVVLVHGSIENGKIFYSKSGKGLAPFLAKMGFSVYVPDLKGRGKSTPPISRHLRYSQTETITQELPVIYQFIAERHPKQKQHWMAHSWGGVLILAFLARHPSISLGSMAFLGTKRSISVVHLTKIWRVDVLWSGLGEILTRVYGYLPAIEWKFGSDNEPAIFYRQVRSWVRDTQKWIDPEDGFDYRAAFTRQQVAPTLYLTGQADDHLGHPTDVQRLMKEVGNPSDRFILLSKKNEHLADYDHISILTSPHAEQDHFPLLVDWIKQHST